MKIRKKDLAKLHKAIDKTAKAIMKSLERVDGAIDAMYTVENEEDFD
jgi:hypothetical protein